MLGCGRAVAGGCTCPGLAPRAELSDCSWGAWKGWWWAVIAGSMLVQRLGCRDGQVGGAAAGGAGRLMPGSACALSRLMTAGCVQWHLSAAKLAGLGCRKGARGEGWQEEGAASCTVSSPCWESLFGSWEAWY
jgi:hypothetical protein